MLHARYGFNWHEDSEIDLDEASRNESLEISSTLRILLETKQFVDPLYHNPLRIFISSLAVNTDIYSRLCDIASLPELATSNGWMDKYYYIRNLDDNYNHRFVFIVPTQDKSQPQWVLTVRDASMVALIWRRVFKNKIDILRYLIVHGISCNVSIKMERSPVNHNHINLPQFQPLAIQPHNYVPTKANYQIYLDQRLSFLKSPRGRAALTQGGILWRLAIDDITLEQGADVEYEYWSKQVLKIKECPYYFYEFTTEDINIISGVYRIEIRK
ncbi:hypothetical protein M422DRAFT_52323 [Sphaerobolus stellatus SS14]|uniref:Uncharacterized protein n=1 Tax=Sphaerobolus stellatus (strain SS14) TaxID=990650 RepID=A0A0C9V8B8_SPHS4|nr:hypothetical protein M422DRAFT_52323 [Sphaerobolus stellatus SS14]